MDTLQDITSALSVFGKLRFERDPLFRTKLYMERVRELLAPLYETDGSLDSVSADQRQEVLRLLARSSDVLCHSFWYPRIKNSEDFEYHLTRNAATAACLQCRLAGVEPSEDLVNFVTEPENVTTERILSAARDVKKADMSIFHLFKSVEVCRIFGACGRSFVHVHQSLTAELKKDQRNGLRDDIESVIKML